jgi:cytidylate kinase
MIIAIDGPSGAGKSTLGRMIARELGLLYIDTGAMYRAAALAVIRSGVSTQDAEAIAKITTDVDIGLEGDPDSLRVTLDGEDVSEEIRSEEVSHTASMVSTISEVRRALVNRQRELGERGRGAVLEGRDIGAVVFPNADVKFFLTAMPDVRAERRFEEDRLHDRDANYENTLADINRRDQRDSTREDSPLTIGEDAIVIDSSELSIDEVYERMMTAIKEQETKPQMDADQHG